jgi:CheY-like chemotaxis protein
MPDTPTLAPSAPRDARPALPLQGLTLLAVEDSRFASEALRLLSQRSGARLRRAETLEQAARHLAVYRPDVVIVDLGLPDGDGADLIRALSASCGDGPVVLGTSGDPAGEDAALAAGAAGFLPKPPAGLAAFQAQILGHLHPAAPQAATAPDSPLLPDRLALNDDLAHAAALLSSATDTGRVRYAAGFVGSLAHSARDAILARAASRALGDAAAVPRLAELVQDRLATAPDPFAGPARAQTVEWVRERNV